ncbi:MAG: hypothetical protein IPK82_20410 [Polyangiaceae bacterium]|nr:hypothetical protein [Polyangiaceae bacterium]
MYTLLRGGPAGTAGPTASEIRFFSGAPASSSVPVLHRAATAAHGVVAGIADWVAASNPAGGSIKVRICHTEEPSNSAMHLTSTLAAQGILRLPCSLRMLAADCHVGHTEFLGRGAHLFSQKGSVRPWLEEALLSLF